MAGFGRLIFSIDFSKLLCSRTNFYQNVSRNLVNSSHEIVLPSKPKKPQTAFLLYLNRVRRKFINEAPNIKASEIVKKASVEWAELNPEEKEDFRRQYNKSYESYLKELQKFEDSLTDEQRELLKEKRKHTDKLLIDKQKKQAFGKPKKPLSAFLIYMLSEKHKKDPNQSYKDWLTSVSTNWHSFSNAEKESYRNQSSELMIQYKKDLFEWEKKMINLGHSDIIRNKTLTEVKNIEEEK